MKCLCNILETSGKQLDEEGGSAYAKAGSSFRSPPGNSRAYTPKTRAKPAPRASIPKSGPCVTLHFPSLANTFLGQRSTARGEGGFGSVSTQQRGAMLGSPSQGHLAPPMGPRRRVAGGALACEKPKRRAQLALVEGSKQPREAFAGSCWAAPR